jgi:hypothetical protein
MSRSPFAAAVVLACLGLAACEPEKAEDTGATDTGRVPEVPFDEDCAAQVMYTQTVCECPELTADWSGVTADSAGAPFDPSQDATVVHWYILGMPVSTLNVRLCEGASLATDVLGADAEGTAGRTETTLSVGEWGYGTGVIALYDTLDEESGAAPRAAAIFEFDAMSTNTRVVLEGRGDVWTGP